MINQKRPNSIDPKQIDREEHHRDQSNDRSVLNLVSSRPRDPAHLSASVTNELRRALDKSSTRSRQPALTSGPSTFRSLAESRPAGRRRSNGLFHGSVARRRRFAQGAKLFGFVFFSGQFFSQCANFSMRSWQGYQDSNPDFRFWRPTC